MSQTPNSLLPYARCFMALYERRPSPAALRGCIASWRALKGKTLEEAARGSQAWYEAGVRFWFLDALTTQSSGKGLETSKAEFMNGMEQTLSEGITGGWEAGVKEVGIEPDEISDEEYAACGEFIAEQVAYLPPVWEWIGTQVGNETARQSVLSRAEVWFNLWNAAATKGKLMAGQDVKMRWTRGPTEKSCPDCLKLDGKVFRARTWQKYDIMPQSDRLSCSGFRCLCSLVPTDERVTPGKPPALVGPK